MMQRLFGPNRSWRWPGPILEDYIGFALLCWGVWTCGIAVIVGAIAWFGEIESSIVVPASGLVYWFLAIFTGYLFHDVLAAWIANGRTRFDAAIEVGLVAFMLVVSATVLVTLSFFVEWLVYRIAGWTTALDTDSAFTERADIHRFVLPLFFVGVAWAAAGALVGAAYYRWQGNGLAMLLPATILVSAASSNFGQPISIGGNMLEWLDLPFVAALLLCIVGSVLMCTLLWYVVRTTPIQRKAT